MPDSPAASFAPQLAQYTGEEYVMLLGTGPAIAVVVVVVGPLEYGIVGGGDMNTVGFQVNARIPPINARRNPMKKPPAAKTQLIIDITIMTAPQVDLFSG